MASSMRRQRDRPITRVKSGCLTCRLRKKKCDEEKPKCQACIRNNLGCKWPARKVSRCELNDDDNIRTDSGDEGQAIQAGNPEANILEDDSGLIATNHVELGAISEGDLDLSNFELSASAHRLLDLYEYAEYRVDTPAINSSQQHSSFTMTPHVLPEFGAQPSELLQHYLSHTANSMGNGSTALNPFLIQFIPLAFSNKLILRLILTQSAVHRARAGDPQQIVLAHKYYGDSLKLFRSSLLDHIEGGGSHGYELAVGALIMCFIETARGDVNGAIFDHLKAAGPLLLAFICSLTSTIPQDMRNFLIEYYIYTAALTMISVESSVLNAAFVPLPLPIVTAAQGLLNDRYIGQLCGCWLELLLIIPDIFEFGCQLRSVVNSETIIVPSADDVVSFSTLYLRVCAYHPSVQANEDVLTAGFIYQKATLLYLITSLTGMSFQPIGMYRTLIDVTAKEAVDLLNGLSPTARINTSLCWPIAVLGSLVQDSEDQEVLRNRLQTMFGRIGLGNIQATLRLLEEVWTLPAEDRNPWMLHGIMQDHGIWISFA